MKLSRKIFPKSSERVEVHTSGRVNNEIKMHIQENVDYYRNHVEGIDQRIDELDSEWDIERAIEVNASILNIMGIGLGAYVSVYWLILPAVVSLFLLQHSLQGWCPPVPIFRRLGFRTRSEIDNEKYRLMNIRDAYGPTRTAA